MEGIFGQFMALFAGCGVFLAGINMLGDGLEKSAGHSMKALLARISNRFTAVGIGAVVTGIIQSSAATSVMAIGFVNAGVMTLAQATAIVMGANIGTTVTGLIVSLKSLPIAEFMALFAFIGVMLMFFKKERIKQIGAILCGLGLLFIGLEGMSGAFETGTEIKDFFTSIFTAIDFPLLLILCGAAFTALIQSSSAATGLFIVLVGAGALSMDNALFLVLGSNIGTCVTAILAAIGTTPSARRVAAIHLMFNLIGTGLFTALLWPLSSYVVEWLQLLGPAESQLAFFHLIFNVTTTLVLVPFVRQLGILATKIIPDQPNAEDARRMRFVDDRLLKTPAVALSQVKKEIVYMANTARENLFRAFMEIKEYSGKNEKDIVEAEAVIDFTNKALTRYLINLSPLVSAADEQEIGAYFHVLNDLERIGDHAENFYEIAAQMHNEGLTFSEKALEEMLEMYATLDRMFALTLSTFEHTDPDKLRELSELEEEMDEWKKRLSAGHFERLSAGNCRIELSAYFFSTVSGLERVADHLINVGYSAVNPTGSQIA